MSRSEEFFGILTSFIAWLWGTMFRQQNNEKLSSEEATQSSAAQQPAGQGNIQPSPGSGQQNDEKPSPTTPTEKATQSSAAQQPAGQGNIQPSPGSAYSNSPTISRTTNSEFSVFQAASANNAIINPSFSGGWTRNSNIKQNEATQSRAAQLPAGQGNIQPSPVSGQQNDEKLSPTYSNTPTISETRDSQFSVLQAAVSDNTTINPSFTRNELDLRAVAAAIQLEKKLNG